mmetsp:Transcript_125643/g.391208  ORF Transcript_125643/g.391208 Transcript_125643/m.391208 type:complete len:351 (-) Transcript_125643:144-1196(-)
MGRYLLPIYCALLVLLGMAVAGLVVAQGQAFSGGVRRFHRPSGAHADGLVASEGPASGSGGASDSMPAAGGLVDGFCGVTTNPSLCDRNLVYLSKLNPTAAQSIFCKELSGSDPCSLAMLDTDLGFDKDPSRCNISPGVIYLWDHPGSPDDETGGHQGEFRSSLCDGDGLPSCAAWAASAWKKYADKWLPQLTLARRFGVRVASPRFQGRDLLDHFAAFFAACPECSERGSKYYIDILAFNAWVDPQGHNGAMASDVRWIKDVAGRLKRTYANRPVALANFNSKGGHTAALQAEVIADSGLFKKGSSVLDAVYYFTGVDFHTVHNFLVEKVLDGPHRGKTIGQVLLEACA